MKFCPAGIPAICILFLFALTADLSGQGGGRLALSLESASTGNGHGTFYCPSVGFQSGRNLFTFGPLCHKRSSEFRGGRLGYSRSLSNIVKDKVHAVSITDLVQLNVFMYAQYTDNVPLSYYTVKELECVSAGADVNWNTVRLSTVEACAGVELRFNLTSFLAWRTCVGPAFYHHTGYHTRMSRERSGNTLMLGTSLLVVLR